MSQVLIVLDSRDLKSRLLPIVTKLASEWRIPTDELEAMYDWIITEAFQRVLGLRVRGHIVNHYRHDIYLCAYADCLGEYACNVEYLIKNLIISNNLEFLENARVKLLITYDAILIVRSNRPSDSFKI